jgi:hypothetical protein
MGSQMKLSEMVHLLTIILSRVSISDAALFRSALRLLLEYLIQRESNCSAAGC